MAAKTKTRRRARAAPMNTQARMIETLHHVWLAGLGAVARAQRGAPQLLEELIKEGTRVDAQARGTAKETVRGLLEDVQGSVQSRIGEIRGRTADALDNLEKVFQARVQRALTQLGMPSAEDIEALSKRVDALNANIEKLARARRSAPRSRVNAVTKSTQTPLAAP